jgi:hypothetical protein
MEIRIFEIPSYKIESESVKIITSFCEIQKETKRGEKILKRCMNIKEKFCNDYVIKVLIMPFIPCEFNQKEFIVNEKIFRCNKFINLDSCNILGGYMYAITGDPISNLGMSTLDMYYVDCWLSSYVEAIRQNLKNLLINEITNDFKVEKYKNNISVSDCYAPGFDGMDMESISDIFELMGLSKYGMKLYDNTIIVPNKTIVGMYLVN